MAKAQITKEQITTLKNELKETKAIQTADKKTVANATSFLKKSTTQVTKLTAQLEKVIAIFKAQTPTTDTTTAKTKPQTECCTAGCTCK